jgi:acetyl-CoA synthetase
MTTHDPQAAPWFDYVAHRVRSDDPPSFEDQWRTFEELSSQRPESLGPLPAWRPDEETVSRANLTAMLQDTECVDIAALHRWSVTDRAAFWTDALDRLGIVFATPPSQTMGRPEDPRHPEFLANSRLDITRSCFRADPDATAILAGREGGSEIRRVTFAELEHLVDRIAGAVNTLGLADDEGVALYMPMTVECVAAYLGVIRAGHHVVSIADSFAAEEVARRVRLGRAGAVITVERFTRGGRDIPLHATVCAAEGPPAIVIPATDAPTLRPGDRVWSDFLATAGDPPPARDDPPERITNVLFSSGTTGDPKAIPWSQLTPIKCIADGHFHQDIRPGDVVAWPTNIGWMMGPWLIYAALGNGAAIALFEGVPTTADFAEFVREARVTVLGVVPSLVRAWRTADLVATGGWPDVRLFSSTGEASNRPDYLWLMATTGYRAPVIEYCGGTEIGGGYITGTVLQPASPATFTLPALGLDLVLLDEAGQPVDGPGEGEVFLVPPSIGLSETLLNRDHDTVYFDGCPPGPSNTVLRRHGDQLARLAGGFYRAQGRSDDTMNLGGIKVSSKELERVLDAHPSVHESAAVAVQPEGGGADRLVVFAHLRAAVDPEDLRAHLPREIGVHLNPLFRIHRVVPVEGLPRTASGKIMRRVLRNTIAEPASSI